MRSTLRLVTYNIQRGIDYDQIRTHFATVPALAEADIVAVQEALVPAGGRNTLARLADHLEGGYRWTYRTVMSYPDKEYGNGFLFRPSATPVAGELVPLPRVDRLGWVARLKTEGGVPDTKSAFAQVFMVAGRRVRVASVHLDFAGGATHRARQLGHLLGALDRSAAGAAGGIVNVVCGDFNTTGHYRSSAAGVTTGRVLAVALARGFTDCSGAVPWTNDLFSSIDDADPARRLLRVGRALGLRYRQKLDHVLVKGARPVAPATAVAGPGGGHLPGSDHVPVSVELRL
jgi:endonuclease/exonuclease/phosphatase family metal-dependent hydrolase